MFCLDELRALAEKNKELIYYRGDWLDAYEHRSAEDWQHTAKELEALGCFAGAPPGDDCSDCAEALDAALSAGEERDFDDRALDDMSAMIDKLWDEYGDLLAEYCLCLQGIVDPEDPEYPV